MFKSSSKINFGVRLKRSNNLELLQELLMLLDQGLVLTLVPSNLTQARMDMNQLEVDH